MTENKRYFKRMWEEEYYIFDSQTISEKEFDEKVQYEDYNAFVDSMMGDEVVNRLNALHEENEQLKSELVESKKAHSNCDKLWWKLHDEKEQLEKENITIKNTIHNMMESERTHIGYNVLKQAYEAIK